MGKSTGGEGYHPEDPVKEWRPAQNPGLERSAVILRPSPQTPLPAGGGKGRCPERSREDGGLAAN